MAKTLSTMLPLGTVAADFSLVDAKTQAIIGLQQVKSSIATVVLFICNHCPFVIHIKAGIIKLADDYMPKGIAFVAINANDPSHYPEDSPEKMATQAYPFPYLFDATQTTAKAYQAACTPDCYIFDASLRCVYRGQFDDSRPGNDKLVTGRDMRQALEALLSGQRPSDVQHPSVGCNIKWK